MIKPVPHGTANGYGNYGCRCDACKEAHRLACLARVPRSPHGSETTYSYGCRCDACRTACTERRRERGGSKPFKPAEHGTESKYHGGCRCDECRAAATAERKRRRLRDPERTRAYDREYKRRTKGRRVTAIAMTGSHERREEL